MPSRSSADLGIAGLGPAELIGEGGNAYVYRSRQDSLDRDVAVKILKRAADDATLRRFGREQRAMGRMSQHDGIVTVYDSGVSDAGEPYLVMPLLPRSLKDEVDARGRLDWAEAVEVIAEVAETVHFAHEAGLVHRDLKPGNLMRSASGRPLVADFGIARIVDAGASMQTTELTLTPAFSPPEALAGGDASPLTDVYALGATLYALIEGHPPFVDEVTANSLFALIQRIKDDPIPAVTVDAPDWIDDVIAAATTKDPADRLSSARVLAALLRSQGTDAAGTLIVGQRALDADRTTAGQSSTLVVTATPAPAPSAPATIEETGRRGGRKRLAVGLVGLIAVAAATVVLWPSGDDRDPLVAEPPVTAPATAVDSTVPPSTIREELAVTTSVARPAFETIVLQAEDQVLTPPMSARTDTDAEGSAFVSTDQVDEGVVRFDFGVTQDGPYRVFARVSSAVIETNHDSFMLRLDDGDADVWDFFEDTGGGTTTWEWDAISIRCGGDFDRHLCNPLRLELDPTLPHTLTLSGREALSGLDVIIITNDPEYDPEQR